MITLLKYATQPRRNSFRHFVQSFWQQHGSTGYDDEWHAYPGRFYADISQNSTFKTIFAYHLELSKIGKFYNLSICLSLSRSQKYEIARKIKTPNKKEAIRAFLKQVKNFENDKKQILIMWQKTTYDIPIVNSEGVWIFTIIIGSASSNLIQKQIKTSGTFYSLEYDQRYGWQWTKYDISFGGHCTSSCQEVSFMTWRSIYGYNPVIDSVIDDAIVFAKQNEENDFLEELAEQYMQAFYDSQK